MIEADIEELSRRLDEVEILTQGENVDDGARIEIDRLITEVETLKRRFNYLIDLLVEEQLILDEESP
jgi:hypothetical protein